MNLSYKAFRLILLIVTPFILLGAVIVQIDPFAQLGLKRFIVKPTSVVETMPCDGQIWYHHVAYLKAPNPGRVDRLLVKIGDQIRAGQTLMDMTELGGAELLDVARAKHSPHRAELRQIFQSIPFVTYFSGLLFQVNISEGGTFTVEDNVFAIADELMANVQVPETSMSKIRIGQRATVVINAMPSQKFTARIKEVPLDGYQPTDGVVLYTIVLQPDALPKEARIGMSTQAFIETDRRDHVLAIPSAAVSRDAGEAYVRVAGFGWTSEKHLVQLGLDSGDMVEVKSGLNAGDVVLVPQNSNGSSPALDKDLLETLGGDPILAEHSEKVPLPDAAPKAPSGEASSQSKSAIRQHPRRGSGSKG